MLYELNKFVYQFSGKILLRNEIPLDENTFKSLISQTLFSPVPSIKKKRFSYECQRCGNQKKSLFANIPCQSCQSVHLYCRKCIEMGRVMECEPLYIWTGPLPQWPKMDKPLSWDGKLTTQQQHAANEIVKTVKQPNQEILVWAVCGSGKTEMLFPGISEALQLGKRVCIASPRADVVRELIPRIEKAFNFTSVQGLYGGSPHKNTNAQLIISTTHQLLRFKEAFDVIIIDEIDAFPFHADPSLPFAAKRAKSKEGSTIYLTATPRKDQRTLIQRKKLPHVFVPIRFHGHPLPVPKLKLCFALKKNLKKNQLPTPFIKWAKTRGRSERQLLIFVPTIQLAERLKEEIKRIFYSKRLIETLSQIQFVHAEDPDREMKITLFRQRQLHVLITTTILERGVTFPSVDVAILDAGHVVFDEAALVQIAGRAGRSAGDPTGEVVFFHNGKTEAIVNAIESIKKMNKRAGF